MWGISNHGVGECDHFLRLLYDDVAVHLVAGDELAVVVAHAVVKQHTAATLVGAATVVLRALLGNGLALCVALLLRVVTVEVAVSRHAGPPSDKAEYHLRDVTIHRGMR